MPDRPARHPRTPVDDATRRRIEHELLNPADPPRPRAQLAREAGVAPRTITRWAEALGVEPARVFDTSTIAAATISATDRRRARRSELADTLLDEVAALIEQAREGRRGSWTRAVVVGTGGGAAEVEHVREDDATVARAAKDLHAAASTALGRTLDIDKHDAQPDDQSADDVLVKLFDGLGAAYRALREQPSRDDVEEGP